MGNKNIAQAIFDDLKNLPKKIFKPYMKNGKPNFNKIAIDGIPFIVIFYMVNKYVQAVSYANGADVLDKCVNAFSLIFQIPPYFMPSFKPVPFFFGIGAGVIFKIIMDARKKTQNNSDMGRSMVLLNGEPKKTLNHIRILLSGIIFRLRQQNGSE